MGRLIVVGVVAAMMTYIFMNVGMNILLVPITGLPLPFISYGGTFMVVVLFMFGLVQSVWVHRNISPAKKPRENGSEA
jgi:rod shape determining protein RodA